MNKAYKLVWNAISNSWVVASELAKGKTKSSSKSLKAALVLVAGISAAGVQAAPAVNALPTGESVASGSASFDRSVTNQLTINQSSSKLITNWNSFDVGSGARVTFAQPDASSIALNRVTSGSASEIFGQVTANGQLVIVNPNGITFGTGSQVSAASIIGSVLDIQDSDFNSGNLLFNRGSATAGIDNQGSLTATAGSVALLAPTVKNSGSIGATAGYVGLVNADAISLSGVAPSVTQLSSIAGLISNTGSINATQVRSVGGKILLQGDTSQSISKLELTGTLTAEESNVNAQQINVAGMLNVDGTNNTLKLSSTTPYNLSFGSKINLNGASSGFSVNGTAYTVIRDVNQLQAMNSNVAGKYVLGNDIDASDTVNWNGGEGFVPLGNFSSIFTGVLDGLGHSINQLTINRPSTNHIGLIGYAQNSTIRNIGLIDNSITGLNVVGGLVGYNYAETGLASISNSYTTGSVKGRSVVGGLVGNINVDNGGTSNITNSYTTGRVTGSFEYVGGLVGTSSAGYGGASSITNSYATGNITGNNRYVGGLVGSNLSQADGSARITNSYATGKVTGLLDYVGGLVGYNTSVNSESNITSSYSTGDVTGGYNYSYMGGLVGYNHTSDNGESNITSSYSTGNVAGGSSVGGLVGHNTANRHSSITNSYATGSVSGATYSGGVGGLLGSLSVPNGSTATLTNNYATGSVTGLGNVGGLIGSIQSTNSATTHIANNYATGSVTGGENVGGLVGYIFLNNSATSHIANNYATGSVTGSKNVGGLVGYNFLTNIGTNYWDTETTGQNNAVAINDGGTLTNLIGLTTAEAFDQSSYAQFDFNDTWFMLQGNSRPMLRSFLNTADSDGRIAVSNLYQLQGLAANLAGSYYLTNNIDAAATAASVTAGNAASYADVWGGKGFAPIGNDSTSFTGVLDGAGYVINGLNIGRASSDYVGLIGNAQGSTVQRIGLSNTSVNGQYRVGGLVGRNAGGSVLNSYVTGSVHGNYMVGGLVGENYGNALVSESYATSNVSADNGAVGGLVGNNYYNSVIKNSYASGNVTGNSNVGGLAGYNEGNTTISHSYASGSVIGSSNVGGLIGTSIQATAVNSYWNSTSTGQVSAIGSELGNNTLDNLIGLTSAQSTQLAMYANWGSDIDGQGGTGSVWRIYEGQTAPLLRSFLKLVNVTIGNDNKTYDGNAYHVTGGSYTLSDPAAILLGNIDYGGGTAEGARNAGTYSLTGNGLYSTQHGYDISYTDGSLTVNKAALSITATNASKVYDASTSANASAAISSGSLFGTDSISGGSFAFADKNAGTSKTVTVSGVTVSDGNNGDNYTVTYVNNTNSAIYKASLAITAADVTKTYDGTTSAKGTAIVSGPTQLYGTDSISGGTFVFDNKNAGTGKTVTVSGVTVHDGNNGGNYDVTYVDNSNSNISKRVLTISATAVNKVYDGRLTTGEDKPLVTGRQRGDSITGLSQSFLDKNVGTGKTVRVNSGFVVNDGNGGNNYNVILLSDNVNGVITPRPLTISTVANTKVYDGGVRSANKPQVTGLASGDRITGLYQQYETKAVGENKKLLIKNGYVVNDGNNGVNYIVTEQTSNNGIITLE